MSFNIKALKLVSLLWIISSLGWALLCSSQPSQPTLRLDTDPPAAQIYPFEAEATKGLGSGQYRPPVQLKLQVLDAAQVPLKDARVRLKILTPTPTPWFTTDFPAVEGTVLLDIAADLSRGMFEVRQMFPIRGDYQLQVEVNPTIPETFKPFKQTLGLHVSEHPLKLVYFGVNLSVLFGVGAVGGWLIGRPQKIQIGEIAPQRSRLLLSGVTVLAILALLFFNISAEVFHHDHWAEDMSAKSGFTESQGLRLEITGDQSTMVGRLAVLQARLIDLKTRQPIPDAVFSVRTVQSEEGWVTFAYEGRPALDGALRWQEQFFDGAPHRIEVKVSPSSASLRRFQPFQTAQTITVESVEPALLVRVIGLIYLTGAVALGTVCGLWMQHRRQLLLRATPL